MTHSAAEDAFVLEHAWSEVRGAIDDTLQMTCVRLAEAGLDQDTIITILFEIKIHLASHRYLMLKGFPDHDNRTVH